MNAKRLAPDVSVVIPVYNSELTIRQVVQSARDVLVQSGRSVEFVLVDDASVDGSWTEVAALAATLENVRALRLRRNYGQHSAILAGVRIARAPVIVTMDDDGQHPSEEIPKLLAALEQGYDVVYGYPKQLPHSFMRNLTSWLTKIVLQKAIGAETARHASAFRAFRTVLREAFEEYRSAYVSIDVLLTWGTQQFTWVEVNHRPRLLGKSNYTFQKLITHGLTMMTGFSTLPLRLSSLMGIAFTLVGFALLVYVLGRYFIQGGAVPGFPFLASAISIFSGAQLFALGILGEYLARVHVRTLGRPSYVIGENVENGTALVSQDGVAADTSAPAGHVR